MFRCIACGELKEISEFAIRKTKRGHDGQCKQCLRVKYRLSYRKVVNNDNYRIQTDPFPKPCGEILVINPKYSEEFERLWRHFDSKIAPKGDKPRAYRAFNALKCDNDDVTMMIREINLQKIEQK